MKKTLLLTYILLVSIACNNQFSTNLAEDKTDSVNQTIYEAA